ncbi:MAG: LCP family protein [Oscillospiraceae bacterium]|nr:LCP family protein [Oscillospiraceae bacterium]
MNTDNNNKENGNKNKREEEPKNNDLNIKLSDKTAPDKKRINAKWKKAAGIVLTVIAIMIVSALAVTVIALYIAYNKVYTEVPIQERTGDYIPPVLDTDKLHDISEIIGEGEIPPMSIDPVITDTPPVQTTSGNNDTEPNDDITPENNNTTGKNSDVSTGGSSGVSTGGSSGGSSDVEPVRVRYDKYVEPKGTKTTIYKVAQKDPNVLNIILLGRDARDPLHDRGRTDAMMIVSYNKKTKDIKVTSLLRDTLVPIEGWHWNRINAAYFFGGTGLCINTVNDVYDMDIQNYVTVTFDSVEGIIDLLGGIEIEITKKEAEWGGWGIFTSQIHEGKCLITGACARAYMQNRSIGKTDFARTNRQKIVLEALFHRFVTIKSISEFSDVINYILNMVQTNMKLDTILSLASSILSNGIKNFEYAYLPYEGNYKSQYYDTGKAKLMILMTDLDKSTRYLHNFIYNY